MNKLMAVISFPFVWVFGFLYRIICYDLFGTLFQIVVQLGLTFMMLFKSFGMFFIQLGGLLWLIITLPIILIIDIPVGLVVCCMSAIGVCRDVFENEAMVGEAIKDAFSKNVENKKKFK